MAKFRSRNFLINPQPQVGASPGELVHLGHKKVEDVSIRVLAFNAHTLVEEQPPTIKECLERIDDPEFIVWIDVAGLHEIEIIQQIGDHFNVHPLVLEDILNPRQRPKIEDHRHYLFLVMRTLVASEGFEDDQVSLVMGKRFVLTFQEREEDIFTPVRERLRNGRPRIRGNGADYLAYALVDAIVDGYFVLLESLSAQIDQLGNQLLTDSDNEVLHEIFGLKKTLGNVRRSVWPMREVINQLIRGENELIQETTALYLRDVYDHTLRAIETIETLRDLTSGLHDLYLSIVSQKMNEVMKVLTIIATIFIPLTFIAGVYGMNFENMPELGWPWAYPVVWLVMILCTAGMVLFFKKKKWL